MGPNAVLFDFSRYRSLSFLNESLNVFLDSPYQTYVWKRWLILFHQERRYIKHHNLCLHKKLCANKDPFEPNTKLEDPNDRFRVILEPI